MGHLFVSYSRSDKDYADQLVTHLEAANIQVWIDRGDIQPGAQYRWTIRSAIDQCDAFVVIMSPAAEEAKWVGKELDWAERQGKPIFPLLLDGEVWFGLTTTHYEDVTGGRLPSNRFIQALPIELELTSDIELTPSTTPSSASSLDEPAAATPPVPTVELIQGHSTRTLRGHTRRVYGCAVAPDGTYIVSASGDQTLRMWDPTTGNTIRTLKGHTKNVYGCAVAPDGTYIVSVSDNRTLRMWDPTTGDTLKDHTKDVNGCAVAPDGSYIVSFFGGTLRLWDPTTGDTIHTLDGHTSIVSGCAVAPDGSYVVSASCDKTLRLWNPDTGNTIRTLKGHTKNVSGCAVAPDGTYIVSVSDDRTLRLWDPDTGDTIRTLNSPIRTLKDFIISHEYGCAVAPDGTYIVSISTDKTLEIWQ